MLSRWRTVTVPSVSVCPSTVTQNGVPISSMRAYRLPIDCFGVVLTREPLAELQEQLLGDSGMPSLFTSGKTPHLIGANCGLKLKYSSVPCRPFSLR